MEQVRIGLPGGGELEALRLQDLPAEHVISFMGLPQGAREMMGVKLLTLALGPKGSRMLAGLTYGELQHVMSEWFFASSESEEHDSDGRGAGLDWSDLLL